MRTLQTFVLATALGLVMVGCTDEATESTSTSDSAHSDWLLASEPAGAVSITQVNTEVTGGDRVAVRGRIGGRQQPLSNESPVFTIVDLSLPHCGEIPGDSCPTPWDYCCEPGEIITANSATVQLVGEDGSPLDVDPIAGGLSPLDEVVVFGEVAPRSSGGSLTIRATGVHVRQ